MQINKELVNKMTEFLLANPQWAWIIGTLLYILTVGAITLIIVSIINLIKNLHKPKNRNGIHL